MIGSILAEIRKLRQRPAVLVTLALSGVLVAVVDSVSYFQATHPSAAERALAHVNLLWLYPPAFVDNTISAIFPLGAAMALVLGALVAGSEYGWSTTKTILTLGPGRLSALAGRLVGLALIALTMTTVLFGVGALASLVIALHDSQSIAWPSIDAIAGGAATSTLVLGGYLLMGNMLGVLFRTPAAAVGVGFAYLTIIESILVRFLDGVAGGTYRWAANLFDAANAQALLQAFNTAVPDPRLHTPAIGFDQALVAIAVYAVFCIAATALLLRERDAA